VPTTLALLNYKGSGNTSADFFPSWHFSPILYEERSVLKVLTNEKRGGLKVVVFDRSPNKRCNSTKYEIKTFAP
jgi:hypothetical protein